MVLLIYGMKGIWRLSYHSLPARPNIRAPIDAKRLRMRMAGFIIGMSHIGHGCWRDVRVYVLTICLKDDVIN